MVSRQSINTMPALQDTCQDLQRCLNNLTRLCSNLHHVNASIFKVETEDDELKVRVDERRRQVEEMTDVIDGLTIPHDLTCSINAKRVDGDFEGALPILTEKIEYCKQAMSKNIACATDVWSRLEPLLCTVQHDIY